MSNKAKDLTNLNFEAEVMKTDQPVLIDFWASWCMPCKMVAPVIDALADEYEGKAKICKVNVDDQPELAGKFGIMSIPTVIIMKAGKVCTKAVGAQSRQAYVDMLKKC
jgi:thioredoxin 1